MGGDSRNENKTPVTSLTERLRSVWRPEKKNGPSTKHRENIRCYSNVYGTYADY